MASHGRRSSLPHRHSVAEQRLHQSLHQIYCYGVYDCFKGFAIGRVSLRGIYGQAFHALIALDQIADVPWIDEIHSWGFWSYSNNVNRWMLNNADVFLLGRVDGPMIGRVFGINQRSIFHFTQGSTGTVLRMFVDQIYSDGTKWPLWMDNLTNGVTVHINQIDAQHVDRTISSPITPLTSASLVHVDGTASCQILQIGIVSDEYSYGPVLDFKNTACVSVVIDQLCRRTIGRWARGRAPPRSSACRITPRGRAPQSRSKICGSVPPQTATIRTPRKISYRLAISQRKRSRRQSSTPAPSRASGRAIR